MQCINYQQYTKPQNPCVFTNRQQADDFDGHSREALSDFLTTTKLTI